MSHSASVAGLSRDASKFRSSTTIAECCGRRSSGSVTPCFARNGRGVQSRDTWRADEPRVLFPPEHEAQTRRTMSCSGNRHYRPRLKKFTRRAQTAALCCHSSAQPQRRDERPRRKRCKAQGRRAGAPHGRPGGNDAHSRRAGPCRSTLHIRGRPSRGIGEDCSVSAVS
jgi:hypothetical protein